MRIVKRLTATAALAATLVAGGTTAAYAADVSWTWETGSGNNIGHGTYTDSGNVMFANDQEEDGKSVLLLIWRNGDPNPAYGCWDHFGAGGDGVRCTLDAFPENTYLRGQLCKGEWASNPANRVITSCGGPQRTFYK